MSVINFIAQNLLSMGGVGPNNFYQIPYVKLICQPFHLIIS